MAQIKNPLIFLQFALYLFIGAIACIIDLSFFSLSAYVFRLPPLLATSLSFALATVANYLLCYKLIFVKKSSHWHQLHRLFWVALVGLGLNTSIFAIFMKWVSLSAVATKVIVVPIVMIWNFWGRRKFVYSPEIPITVLKNLNSLVGGRFSTFFRE